MYATAQALLQLVDSACSGNVAPQLTPDPLIAIEI